MNEVLQTVLNQLIPILVTMLTGVVSYLGMTIKNMMQKEAIEKEKKEIPPIRMTYLLT